MAESAVMLAVATALSVLKLFELPYGGSITVASMLPIILIAYRYGTGWGLLIGLLHGVIQQLLGLNTLGYVTTWQSIVAVIVLDYLLAFSMTGLGGVFRARKNQPAAVLLGVLLACSARYVLHVIAGATVWVGLSIPTNAALLYSLGYNATYMIPETIVTAVVGYYIASSLDFRHERIRRMATEGVSERALLLRTLAGLVLTATIVAVTVLLFMHMQDPETGDFIFSEGLKQANWTAIGITAGAGAVITCTLLLLGRR